MHTKNMQAGRLHSIYCQVFSLLLKFNRLLITGIPKFCQLPGSCRASSESLECRTRDPSLPTLHRRSQRLSAEVEITLSLLVSRTTEKMQAKNLCTHTFTHLLLILLSSKHQGEKQKSGTSVAQKITKVSFQSTHQQLFCDADTLQHAPCYSSFYATGVPDVTQDEVFSPFQYVRFLHVLTVLI